MFEVHLTINEVERAEEHFDRWVKERKADCPYDGSKILGLFGHSRSKYFTKRYLVFVEDSRLLFAPSYPVKLIFDYRENYGGWFRMNYMDFRNIRNKLPQFLNDAFEQVSVTEQIVEQKGVRHGQQV